MKCFSATLLMIMAATAHGQDAVVDELRSQHAEWRRQVQFQSTYRLRQGFAKDIEDVFDGEPFRQVARETRGVFNKMEVEGGELFRVSAEHEELADTTDPDIPADLLFHAHGPQDEVTWSDLKLEFCPSDERAGLTRMSENPRQNVPIARLQISPLNPFPGFDRDPLAGAAILGGEAEFQTQSPDDETTVVTITSKLVSDDDSYTQTNVVELWTRPELPVVRRIHRRIVDGNGDLYLERDARLSEFHRCSGGMVARRVLFADRFRGLKESVRVTEWVSSDLGDRAPVEDDFAVRIPADISVNGVVLPPAAGRERRLFIRDLVPTF